MYDGNVTPSGMGDGRTFSETVTDKNDQNQNETPNEGLYQRNRIGTCRDQIDMEMENDVFDEPTDDKQHTSQTQSKLKAKRRGRPKKCTHNPPTEKKRKINEINNESEGLSDSDENEVVDQTDTQNDDGDDNCVWEILAKAVKVELKEHIKNKEIQDLIECFDVDTYQRDGGLVTTEKIKEYIEEGNQGKESIIQTIKLLMKTHKEIEYLSIDELVIILINEIDKRMPKKCRDCNEYYTDKLTEIQKLECITCNIGHHGCNEESHVTKIKGWKWMCDECETLIKENDDLLHSLRLIMSIGAINNKQKICKNNKKRKRVPEQLEEKSKKTWRCGECTKIIHSRSPSIGCKGCTAWLHIKCAGFKSTKAAEKDQETFKCNTCQKVREVRKNQNDGFEDGNETEDEVQITSLEDINVSFPQNGDDEAKSTIGDKNTPIIQNKNNKESYRSEQLKSEIQSFSPKTWLHDSHIDYLLKNLQRESSKEGPQVWFVDPTVVQFLKYASSGDVESTLDAEDAWWKDFIFMPINDCGPNDKVEGGIHWSLLVFSRKENTWYYMDSGQHTNKNLAQTLVNKLNKYMFSFSDSSPSFVISNCTKQKNNYDCGPFVMLFAQTASKRIANCEPLDTCFIDEGDVKTLRKWIRNQMEKELHLLSTAKADTGDSNLNKNPKDDIYVNKTQTNKRVPLNNDKKQRQQDNHTYNHKMVKVCWKWVNDKCWRGKNCKFEHPSLCNDILNNQQCNSRQCNQYHPQICRANKNKEMCRWGEQCKFRHINNNIYIRGNQQKHANAGNYKNRNKPYDNYEKLGYKNEYNAFSNNKRSRDWKYGDTGNFHKEWPTPWEGKMLKRLRQMVNMEESCWETSGW